MRTGRGLRLAVAVVITLAFGIGTLTTAFSLVNAALFRQPPFHDAHHLALLFLERNPAGEPPRQERWSFARFERLRQRQQSFELVASYSPATVTLSAGGTAELVYIERVSSSYFPVLASPPRVVACSTTATMTRRARRPSRSSITTPGQHVWQRIQISSAGPFV
jgi:hypothetical protein